MRELDAEIRARKPALRLIPLPRSFYEPSAGVVAPRLLGHWLIRQTVQGPCGGVIVETEAYLHDDPACHAFGGETPRNRAMYGPPGHAYVYFIYGNHHCVNAVCRPKGRGEAVLIRAIEASLGETLMRARRPARSRHEFTNGPGKLCAALDIGRELDGADLCDTASPLWIAKNPDRTRFLRRHGPRVATPRIGITRAAELPLRFCLAGSGWLSRKA
jgi:DNA-3-methyladenine glycosylase